MAFAQPASIEPAARQGAAAGERGERLLGLRHKGLLALLAVCGLIALLGALVMAYKASTEADFDALARLVAPQDSASHGSAVATRMAQVRERGRAVAVTLAVIAGLGVVLIGVVVVLFFARLSSDIEALRGDALAVVAGGRTPPPPLQRDDELGDLSAALGALVRSLAAREADLEIERRHAFHREKMGAIGALAAGVLNDIGNPIAAIDGFARAMKETHDTGACSAAQGLCHPDLILHETARLQVITRQIAQLAAEQPSQPQWLSLNDIVRTMLLLVHFDPRLSGVRVHTELDPQLPAVPGVADRLLQLVMGLTLHAAEAAISGGRPGAARSLISIKTSRDDHMVELSLADNGPAMNAELIERAFGPRDDAVDAVDSTASTPGLATCRAIVAQHGGTVQVDRAGALRVRLPVSPVPSMAGALA